MSVLDIFGKTEDNSPVWVESAEGLDKAKERLAELRSETGGEYGVFDTRNGLWMIPFEGTPENKQT